MGGLEVFRKLQSQMSVIVYMYMYRPVEYILVCMYTCLVFVYGHYMYVKYWHFYSSLPGTSWRPDYPRNLPGSGRWGVQVRLRIQDQPGLLGRRCDKTAENAQLYGDVTLHIYTHKISVNVYVYVYIYIYIYPYVYVYTYTYTYTYIHIHIHIYMYMCVFLFLYTYIHTYVCICFSLERALVAPATIGFFVFLLGVLSTLQDSAPIAVGALTLLWIPSVAPPPPTWMLGGLVSRLSNEPYAASYGLL